MKFFTENNVKQMGINWNDIFEVIKETIMCKINNDYAQPIKPYLRYRNIDNRIIAMPAFVGGNVNASGIKWIASFPDNINKGIARANSVTILNNANTGEIDAIFNTTLLSVIRTSAVTGTFLKEYLKNNDKKLKFAIIGFGPIGQMHYKMINEYFATNIDEIKLFDLRPITKNIFDNTKITKTWQDAYDDADIVINCTVSKNRYINKKPKDNALLLDISLRDYEESIYKYVKGNIIVDDWDEVNRENTDIELFYKKCGLTKIECYPLEKIFEEGFFKNNLNYLFCPMGMAIFDIAVAKYYLNKSNELNIGNIF